MACSICYQSRTIMTRHHTCECTNECMQKLMHMRTHTHTHHTHTYIHTYAHTHTHSYNLLAVGQTCARTRAHLTKHNYDMLQLTYIENLMVNGITYHDVKFSNNHCLLEAIEKAWQCTIAVVNKL